MTMLEPAGLVIGLKGALGLVCGSFMNLSAQRAAQGRPWIAGRSTCDHCGVGLSYADTTPLLGYVMARGRCAICRKPISPVHPLAELAGMAIWLTPARDLTFLAVQIVLGLALLHVALFDLRTLRVPNTSNLVLAGLGALLAALEGRLAVSVLAGLTAVLLLEIARRLYRKRRGRDGFGGGDVKLIGALIVALGPQAGPWMLVVAVVLALVWSLTLRPPPDQPLAFAPFLALSGWALLALGSSA